MISQGHPSVGRFEMNLFVRFGQLPALAIGIALLGVGCHSNQAATASNSNAQNQAQDPAAANLAPASQGSSSQASTSQASASQGSSAPMPDRKSTRLNSSHL